MPQMVKNLPARQETQVGSLSQEDPLEEEMATHCSILAWRILTDRGAWRATVHGVAESDTTEHLSMHTHTTHQEHGTSTGSLLEMQSLPPNLVNQTLHFNKIIRCFYPQQSLRKCWELPR